MSDHLSKPEFDRLDNGSLRSEAGVVRIRHHLDNLSIEQKVQYIMSAWDAQCPGSIISFRMLFWNGPDEVLAFLSPYRHMIRSQHVIRAPQVTQPNDGPEASAMDIEAESEKLFEVVLRAHLNSELAQDPSINIRLRSISYSGKGFVLFDIYDDRGMDVYLNVWPTQQETPAY